MALARHPREHTVKRQSLTRMKVLEEDTQVLQELVQEPQVLAMAQHPEGHTHSENYRTV